MLANYNVSDFGVHEQVVLELVNREDDTSTVREDVSVSNLAILALPLLMSLPPISLYDVSDNTVLWWVFATDILAALPLLIKGIELVVSVTSESTNVHADTRIWDATPVAFFETYFMQCDQVRNDRLGTTLIVIAIWVIVASCFCEYLFWRRSRGIEASDTERRVMLGETQDEDGEDHLQSFESDMRQSWLRDGIQFLKSELWNGRHKWITLIALSYLAVGPVSHWFLDDIFALNEYGVHNLIHSLITTLTLFVLHVFSTRTELWPSLSFGEFLWVLFSVSISVMVGYSFNILFDFKRNFPQWPVSSGIYCIFVLIVHVYAVGRKNIDWSQWFVCALSFSSGLVFGPLCTVFKDCFPEVSSDEMFKMRVRCSGWAGLLSFLALVLLAVGFSTGHIPVQISARRIEYGSIERPTCTIEVMT